MSPGGTAGGGSFDPSYDYDDPLMPGQQAAGTAGGSVQFDPSYGYDTPFVPGGETGSGGTGGGAIGFDPSFGFGDPFTPSPAAPATLLQTIQAAINAGNALTGGFIGTPHGHFRCTSKGPVIARANQLGILSAAYAQRGNFKQAGSVKNDEWIGYFDGSLTQVGDYLTTPALTYFIAQQRPLLPYLCVACNRIVSFYRPAQVTSFGVASTYGGNTVATETALASGWPASILQGTKGEHGDVSVPDSVRSPWFSLRVAAIPGVIIDSGDIVQDDLSRRYTVSSSELTEYGWRLTIRLNTN